MKYENDKTSLKNAFSRLSSDPYRTRYSDRRVRQGAVSRSEKVKVYISLSDGSITPGRAHERLNVIRYGYGPRPVGTRYDYELNLVGRDRAGWTTTDARGVARKYCCVSSPVSFIHYTLPL